jgi:hypothetical protein
VRIILSPEDVNVYLSQMLEQAGMTVDGTIEWTWNDDGPSAIVTLGAPKAVALPEPPKPRVEKVTVKLPSRQPEEPEELTIANAGDPPEEEMPKTKKKTRGPGKKTIKTDTKQLNITPRVRAYQEEVARNAKLLVHPITGAVVNNGANESSEFPKKD